MAITKTKDETITATDATATSNANATPTANAIAASSASATSNGSAALTTTSSGAPPDPSTVPTPPQGFVQPNRSDFRGVRPKKMELAAVPDAVLELQGFADYGAVLGQTAPPLDQVVAALTLAYQWTRVSGPTTAWAAYVRAMDEVTWKSAFALVDALKPSFALASQRDPTLAARYPALARFLSAAKVIAQKANATKKRVAQGKPVRSKAANRTLARKAKAAAQARGAGAAPQPPAAGSGQPGAQPAASPAPAGANGAQTGAGGAPAKLA
jgi:hypothetical protein